MKFATFAGAAALAAMGISAQAQAASFEIIGTTAQFENNCTAPVLLFAGDDCTYNASKGDFGGWTGPYDGGFYYHLDGSNNQVAGIPVTGVVTIDMPGDPSTALVSLNMTFAAAFRDYDTSGFGDRAIDSWDSIEYTMGPTAVTSATANAHGGVDLVIGIIPSLLVDTQNDALFPSLSGSGFGTSNWSGPAANGIATWEGNTGGTTTAVLNGYQCTGACGTNLAWNSNDRADFDNLLLRISLDADGKLIDGFAILVDETRLLVGNPLAEALLGTGPNSWQATTMDFVLIPVPGAVWFFASALGLMAWIRRRATV